MRHLRMNEPSTAADVKRGFWRKYTSILTVTSCISLLSSVTYANVYLVNANNDRDMSCGYSDECSLREAIKAANANPGSDVIRFVTDGPIILNTVLPAVSDPLVINGEISDEGDRITIDGTNVTYNPETPVFHILSSNTTVKNMRFVNFTRLSAGLPGPSVIQVSYASFGNPVINKINIINNEIIGDRNSDSSIIGWAGILVGNNVDGYKVKRNYTDNCRDGMAFGFNATNGMVSDNIFNASYTAGVAAVFGAHGNAVKDNVLSNTLREPGTGQGILSFLNAGANTYKDNIISGNERGIAIFTTDSVIKDNHFSDNDVDCSIVSGNEIKGNNGVLDSMDDCF